MKRFFFFKKHSKKGEDCGKSYLILLLRFAQILITCTKLETTYSKLHILHVKHSIKSYNYIYSCIHKSFLMTCTRHASYKDMRRCLGNGYYIHTTL